MWLILTLVGHLANALVFLSDKAFVEKLIPSPRALAFIAGISGVFTFVLIPRFLVSAAPDVVLAGIGSGIIFIAALIFFYTALDRDEVSRVVPAVGGITPLFTYGLSFFLLGERLQGELAFAFLLLVTGGFLIEFRSLRNLFSRRIQTTLSLEILAAFFFAASAVLQKYAFEGTDDISAFLWSRIGGAAAALPLLLSASVRGRLKFSEIAKAGFDGGALYVGSRILAGIAPLILVAAIALGSVTLVNALQGVQYVFLFLLAIIFSRRWPSIFGEVTAPAIIFQKSIAMLLVIAGLALLM